MDKQKLYALLDSITDAVVPALGQVQGIEITRADREALSDWLQDRFYIRAERALEGPED